MARLGQRSKHFFAFAGHTACAAVDPGACSCQHHVGSLPPQQQRRWQQRLQRLHHGLVTNPLSDGTGMKESLLGRETGPFLTSGCLAPPAPFTWPRFGPEKGGRWPRRNTCRWKAAPEGLSARPKGCCVCQSRNCPQKHVFAGEEDYYCIYANSMQLSRSYVCSRNSPSAYRPCWQPQSPCY